MRKNLVNWLEFIRIQKEKALKTQESILHIRNFRLKNCFVAWRSQTTVQLMTQKAIEVLRQKYIKMKIKKAFNLWHEYASNRASNRRKVSNFVVDILEKKKKLSFENWTKFLRVQKKAKSGNNKAISHYSQWLGAMSLSVWKKFVADRKQELRKFTVIHRKHGATVMRDCFALWKALTATQILGSRVQKIYNGKLLWKATAGWLRVVREKVDSRKFMS